MAALVQGVQYGLSSQGNFQEDKSLIFVKLTDSAYRAIEDYLRNRSKSNQQPTIQFQGKEGHLSFPAPDSSHGQTRFKFSLSSFEGPQGSFECISQKGSRSLETVGAMQCNMRIQAKDDVYEATKHRMAVVEENQKNKCTREIKPGGPGIGRKVKVKNPILPPRRDREYLGPSAPALKNSSSIKASSNGFPPFSHNNVNGNFVPSSQHTKPQGNNHAQKPGNPDIMRRPIKERLIQLLAVRPYKKPELYDRLFKDGLRDREKHCLSVMLKQVAQMKDNTYHLIRHVWNDVQEDWPFYTEQERQSLKRRKPQNLTPPGSSDGGSSGSGQSPTSTHPGSPPSTISSSYSAKRPGYMEGADGLPTKRQRISHYRKPADLASVTSYRLPDSSQQHQRSAAADSSSRANDMLSYRRQERQDSPRHNGGREFAGGGRNNNNNNNSGGEMTVRNNGYNIQSNGDSGRCTGTQENEENVGGSAQGSYESVVSSGKYRLAHSETLSSRNGGDNSVSVSSNVPSEGPALGWNNRADSGSGVLSTSTSSRGHGGHHDNRNSRWNTNNGGAVSSTQSITSHHSSPDSQLENVDSNAGGPKDSSKSTAGENNSEYPEYLMSYTSIRNSEQRCRYKADFNADYSEYRDLHAVVEKVSRRFAQLEERLRQHEKNSPAYKSIKQQIVQEYQENKRDLKHQEAKKRFQYLHEKLSHIKRLVLEYDSQAMAGGDRY